VLGRFRPGIWFLATVVAVTAWLLYVLEVVNR
jgi:hypothetical protein